MSASPLRDTGPTISAAIPAWSGTTPPDASFTEAVA